MTSKLYLSPDLLPDLRAGLPPRCLQLDVSLACKLHVSKAKLLLPLLIVLPAASPAQLTAPFQVLRLNPQHHPCRLSLFTPPISSQQIPLALPSKCFPPRVQPLLPLVHCHHLDPSHHHLSPGLCHGSLNWSP